MRYKFLSFLIVLLFFIRCKDAPKNNPKKEVLKTAPKDSVKVDSTSVEKANTVFKLTEENSIDFFFEYSKDLEVDKVKITTSLGSFTIQLYDKVPYHKANFIYLTRKGYFNKTQFHRVVKNFIIQGGNSDDKQTAKKRSDIGRYLLPPDTKKGYKHDRGTVSMPSSEINNPHMLASPFEFFIVTTKPGSYHLDGEYTPFGKVIQGMQVVDKINNVAVGKGDWPSINVYIEKAVVLE